MPDRLVILIEAAYLHCYCHLANQILGLEVSRAFQVLSDPDKKSKYDRFGGDPDSRFGTGAGPSSPFSNFARSASAGTAGSSSMFEEEISPEELFRQFFGGGMGGPGGGLFGGPFGMPCCFLPSFLS